MHLQLTLSQLALTLTPLFVSYHDDGVQIINISDPTNIVAVDAETDGVNGFTKLDGPHGVDTFVIDSNTYAIVPAVTEDGVQIINISDPTNIVAVTLKLME